MMKIDDRSWKNGYMGTLETLEASDRKGMLCREGSSSPELEVRSGTSVRIGLWFEGLKGR